MNNFRYYQEEIVLVRMLNTTLPYGYEYIGNTSRLVVTPLTERCFRSLIGAYHMNLHGAPEGPPETGKTETVRDLAKAVGIFCFIFSCTATHCYTAVGNVCSTLDNFLLWVKDFYWHSTLKLALNSVSDLWFWNPYMAYLKKLKSPIVSF